jgi:superfamily I DNA/RNA helicase/mRNA-degrading endonuclease RelE of RelBE toxin-antitoxin system
MAYQLGFTPTFYHENLDLPKHVQKQINRKLRILEQDPISAQGDAKKIKGYDNLYRVRLGDYRLFYLVGEQLIKLLSVRKRDERTYSDEFSDSELPSAMAELEAIAEPSAEYADYSEYHEYAAPAATPAPPNNALPSIQAEQLAAWRIPGKLHGPILACRTEEDLLNLAIPSRYIELILDKLFPRDLALIAEQPSYHLGAAENIELLAEYDLSDFLLQLSPEQEQMVQIERAGPMLVRGGPGTGKSTLALYRVKHLRERGYERILFTTFTNALTNYSSQLLQHLLGDLQQHGGVEILTADKLAMQWYRQSMLAQQLDPANIATEGQALELLKLALQHAPMPGANSFAREARRNQLDDLGLEFLYQEIKSVILAWPLEECEQYLQTKRRGRSQALRAELRSAIWNVYEYWRDRMQQERLISYELIRYHAYLAARASANKPYQALIIDEAQDLTPVTLRFLLALVESYEQIYITADAAQSIYERNFSWSQIDAALNMRGRSLVLKRNYRNTQQIVQACAQIMQDHQQEFDPETLYPQVAIHQGAAPEVCYFYQHKQQAELILHFLQQQARQYRMPVHSAAVLCANQRQAELIAAQLSELGCPAEFQQAKQINIRAQVVKVLTIHSAKGLEFPFVAVLGLQNGVLPPKLEHYPEDEHEALLATHRRLFFVACSRAMRALLVCAPAHEPSPFLASLGNHYWNWSEYHAR